MATPPQPTPAPVAAPIYVAPPPPAPVPAPVVIDAGPPRDMSPSRTTTTSYDSYYHHHDHHDHHDHYDHYAPTHYGHHHHEHSNEIPVGALALAERPRSRSRSRTGRREIRAEIRALERELTHRPKDKTDREIVHTERLPNGELVVYQEETEQVHVGPKPPRIEKNRKGQLSLSLPKFR